LNGASIIADMPQHVTTDRKIKAIVSERHARYVEDVTGLQGIDVRINIGNVSELADIT